jgi:hypothetical protein
MTTTRLTSRPRARASAAAARLVDPLDRTHHGSPAAQSLAELMKPASDGKRLEDDGFRVAA